MVGKYNGFLAKVREKNPDVTATNRFLHREGLVVKTVPDDFKKVLDTSVKMVNFVKSRPLNSRLLQLPCKQMSAEHKSLLLHTEVRWLSCGKVLHRIYQFKEVVKFISENKSETNPCVNDEIWWVKPAYLTDIFSHLNELNTKMQGRNEILLTSTDKLYGFPLKLNLWQTNVAQGVFEMSPLTETVANAENRDILKSIGGHLEMLRQRFKSYFPDLDIPSMIE